VIDSSWNSSHPGNPLTLAPELIKFLQTLVETFDISPSLARVGVVQFDDKATFPFGFNVYGNQPSLVDGLAKLIATGPGRNYAAAFRLLIDGLFGGMRKGVKKAAIFITDGDSDKEVNETLAAVNITKNADVEVFVIGITNNVNTV
jgi:hypothetical protein